MELTARRPPMARGRAWVRANPAMAVLAGLMVIGLLLRVYFLLVWRPAITGYSDSGIYFQGGVQSVWSDPLRTVGYSMFLRLLHGISPHLLLVTIVQHLLGLASALLFYAATRRAGGPRWAALAPAAIIALGGDQLFLEHAALSDAVFIFLLAAMLYCTIRARAGSLRWAALAGLLAGLAVWDREAAIELAPVLALWLVFSYGRPRWDLVATGGLTLVVAIGTVNVYEVWRHAETGQRGLTTNGNWNVYGRAAPWADCSKFTPPQGTQQLCDPVPVSQRHWKTSEYYIYDPRSPAQKLLGPPYLVSKDPYAMRRLLEFSESAIWGQPLDYLRAVWLDVIRLFNPGARSYGDLSAQQLIDFMLYGPDMHSGTNSFVSYWQQLLYPGDSPAYRGPIGPLKTWEKLTRITGVWMALLLALCLASPWLVPRPARAGAILFGLVALVLLFFPILTKSYDYRFVIPAFGPLFAVGALSTWGLGRRTRAWRARRAAATPASP
ncbi:MAG: glycosyltransferase family 39 protein [Solirubrobacteraceae bacterium]